jgi:hypothetical protein
MGDGIFKLGFRIEDFVDVREIASRSLSLWFRDFILANAIYLMSDKSDRGRLEKLFPLSSTIHFKVKRKPLPGMEQI